MAAQKWTDNKTFQFIFFGLEWEEITSYGQKDFWETKIIVCAK